MSNTFQVTVVIDTQTPPQWIVSTLKNLDQNQQIQLSGIIVQPSENLPNQARQTGLQPLAHQLLYGYLNRPRFNLEPCKPEPLPATYQQLVADTESSSTPDLLLHLGHYDQDDDSLPIATHGTWVVKHKELTALAERAVLARHNMLWLHLWKIDNRQASSIKNMSSHALPMQSYSITDVLTYAFGSLPDFIASRLNWLANGSPTETQFDIEPITSPSMSGIEQLGRSIKLLYLQVKQRLRRRLQIEQWQLAFVLNNDHAVETQLSDYVELIPPANHIWADPHLIVEDNQTHVFFEELEIEENRGRIAWAILTPEGFANEPITVLAEDHHLSYPFVFKHNNDFYMVPETASTRTISLYKATRFPDKWTRIDNIMDNVNAADTTLFQHDGLWWVFTNGSSHPSVDERDQLNLYYAEDFLSGDWQPHPLNPVVTGVDHARMAGKIYQKNGELFRPSQYGAKRYGFGFNTSRIDVLNTTQYQETLIKRQVPSQSEAWIGCHSAAHSDNLNVIDRLRRVRR